ncbi:MAG: AAA family ATPase [Candidatus Electrothrix scaldis]|nr:MAG: AAA family ATPase [Candidatus Electrothrix sp. GW3-3]
MKIQRLTIENFRGIREMELAFHPRLNVFAGKNGVGKTTILEALGQTIDIARLNHVAGNEKQNLESRGIINSDDTQINAEHARLDLQLSLKNQTITTTASSNPEEISSDLFNHFPEANIKLPHITLSESRSAMAGTYAPPDKTMNMISGIDSLIGIIVNNTTRYGHYFAWISEREALENNRLRKFIDSGKVFGKDHFEKDNILQRVKKVIEDITGFSGLFHDRERYGFTLQKDVGKEKDALLFSQLSSGEKHLVAFVTMIAVYLAATFSESTNPLQEQAIFLIDAIELHLHPSWQRELIPKLLHSFPGCQFIITTHSPQVLGNIKPESIFLLKRENDEIICEHPDESYGMTMDRVLELVMDEESRPNKKIREDIEHLFDHISRKEFDKASHLLKALKQDIPSDPEVLRAEMLLHKKGLSL